MAKQLKICKGCKLPKGPLGHPKVGCEPEGAARKEVLRTIKTSNPEVYRLLVQMNKVS